MEGIAALVLMSLMLLLLLLPLSLLMLVVAVAVVVNDCRCRSRCSRCCCRLASVVVAVVVVAMSYSRLSSRNGKQLAAFLSDAPRHDVGTRPHGQQTETTQGRLPMYLGSLPGGTRG
ncbi:hypothetical protein N9L68_02470 [bacterium]|nr:hypothetical protein [bacterium]